MINGFIIDELCYIISSVAFIMTPTHSLTKVRYRAARAAKNSVPEPSHEVEILTLGKGLHFVAKEAVGLLVGHRRPANINHDYK